MEKSNFDELMHRYLTNQVTERERTKIEAWLEVMKTEDNGDLELSKEDEELLFRQITSNEDNIGEIVSIVPRRGRKRLLRWMLRVAAALVLVALASYTVFLIDSGNRPLANQIQKLVLNDGSLVWLRGNSQLQYYHKNEGKKTYRYAELNGEGLFEVAKDATRPFIIQCGEVSVMVIGTSFNLKAMADTIELSVLTGKVTVSSTVDSMSTEVSPNEKVIYHGKGRFEKFRLTDHEETMITTGTEYAMAFTDAPMHKLIERLEEKFSVDITVTDNRIENCYVTLDLTDHSLEKSLQLLSEILHIEYALDGKEIAITGSGCQDTLKP